MGQIMITIRLPKKEGGKAWRAMIEIGPIRLIAPDPVYEVLPAHLDLLKSLQLSYKIVKPKPMGHERRRHGISGLKANSTSSKS